MEADVEGSTASAGKGAPGAAPMLERAGDEGVWGFEAFAEGRGRASMSKGLRDSAWGRCLMTFIDERCWTSTVLGQWDLARLMRGCSDLDSDI